MYIVIVSFEPVMSPSVSVWASKKARLGPKFGAQSGPWPKFGKAGPELRISTDYPQRSHQQDPVGWKHNSLKTNFGIVKRRSRRKKI